MKSSRNTRRYVRFGITGVTAGRLIHDPAASLSYLVRAGLRAATDPVRQPGVCRVIDPQTGQVLREIDPITRRVIPGAP